MSTNTITAHGRSWPLVQQQAYVIGAETRVDTEREAEEKAATLRLAGFVPTVEPVTVFGLSDEDQAEMDRLDKAAVVRAKEGDIY